MEAAVAPAAVAVTDLGSGQIQVRGALTFATARAARIAGAKLLQKGAGPVLVIDCGGVSVSDSAGLAVLVDWLAVAKLHGRGIRFKELPPALHAVAQISDVESILIQGITAHA
jgi:phospholipid transport system transporter-binding protein